MHVTLEAPFPLNRLRKQWREGRPNFGAIATISSIATVQIMARSGFDWIIATTSMVRSILRPRMP
jgi:4-hydroxy-2-oxoheptanedioate aldolase